MQNRPTKVGFALVVFALAAGAVTCTDPPAAFFTIDESTADDDFHPIEPQHVLGAYQCRVTVRAALANPEMSCTPTGSATNGGGSPIIVGGQGENVMLDNDPIQVDEVFDRVVIPVDLTNLMSLPIGTPDGTTRTNVFVFFQQEPQVPVEISDFNGVGTFLAPNQKYYRYDHILEQNETSDTKQWTFRLNGATSFEFGVLVAADQPQTGVAFQMTLDWETGIIDAIIANAPVLFGQNFGHIRTLIALIGGAERVAGLIQFDLSSIPKNAEIVDAELQLVHALNVCGDVENARPPDGPCRYDVHRMRYPWEEDEINWFFANYGDGIELRDPPPKGEVVGSLVIDDGQEGKWREWSVGPLVADWYEGNVPNYGFWIETNPEQYIDGDTISTWDVNFLSSEHDTPEWRPKLEVTYQFPE